MSSTTPLVSVWCPSYNHEKYIAQTIEGFLLQKVNFPLEIIIHDDASTDKTAVIIRSYEQKFPNRLSPIYQKENQFSKDPSYLTKTCFTVCRGKYIALCEGDDYWTDPLKLQKQVDFLERNTDFSSCFHNVSVLKENKLQPDDIIDVESSTTIHDLARGNYIRTCSYMLRNHLIKKLPDNFIDLKGADYFYFLRVASHGKIKKFPEVMGVYRKHEGGIWSSHDSVNRFKIMLRDLELLFPYFDEEVTRILKGRHAELLFRFATYIAESKLQGEATDILYKSIGENTDAFLSKIAGLVYDNTVLKEKQKSLKHTLKNVVAITKSRIKKK